MKHLQEYLFEQQMDEIQEGKLKDKVSKFLNKFKSNKNSKEDAKEDNKEKNRSFNSKMKNTKDDFYNLIKLMSAEKLLNYKNKTNCESAFEYIINSRSFSPNKVTCELKPSSVSIIGLDESIEKLINNKSCGNASFYNPETLDVEKMKDLDIKDLTEISKKIKNYAPCFTVNFGDETNKFHVNHKNTISDIHYTVNDNDIIKNIDTTVNYIMALNNKQYNIQFDWEYNIIYKNGTFEKPSKYSVDVKTNCTVKVGAEHKVKLSDFFADMCKRLDIDNDYFKDVQDREMIWLLQNINANKHNDFYVNIYGILPIILFMTIGSYEFYKKWDYWVTH